MSATAYAVLWGRLAWHPAVEAWNGFSDGPVEPPEHIEILQQSSTSATYRLVADGGGRSIVARRSLTPGASIERTVHERILPSLPVTSPRYCGFRADGTGRACIFLEAAGDERYAASDPTHRSVAGRWAGMMHSAGARLSTAASLPDAGPSRYLGLLRSAREIIRTHMTNRMLSTRDVSALERLATDLDVLDDGWSRLEEACAGVPATVTHGDYRLRHAYVRRRATGLELLLLNWEMAGWGVPTVDLTHVDLDAYLAVIQPTWPGLELEDLQRLVTVGHVFGHLAAIRAVTPRLGAETTHELRPTLDTLESLHAELTQAGQTLGDRAAGQNNKERPRPVAVTLGVARS